MRISMEIFVTPLPPSYAAIIASRTGTSSFGLLEDLSFGVISPDLRGTSHFEEWHLGQRLGEGEVVPHS